MVQSTLPEQNDSLLARLHLDRVLREREQSTQISDSMSSSEVYSEETATDSAELSSSYPEDDTEDDDSQGMIFAIEEDKTVNPIIQHIYDGDYSVFGTKTGNSAIHGECQLVGSLLHFNGPRSQLYRLITILFPFISISYSCFMRRTKTIIHSKNRTDLCSVCLAHEYFVKLHQDGPGTEEIKSPNYQLFLNLFAEHMNQQKVQREQKARDLSSLTPNQRLVIMDYKENIKTPISKNQEGKTFYTRTQTTCLTFLVHKRETDSSLSKTVITFFSSHLSHTGLFTLHCLYQALKESVFTGAEEIILWSDGGPHFRCREVVGNLLSSYMRDTLHFRFTVNYFAPSHGKSEVDAVFGLFANVLKEYTPIDEIHVADELRNFFENKFRQFSVGRKYYPRTYIFKVFVFLFYSLLTFLSIFFTFYGRIRLWKNRASQTVSYLPGAPTKKL